MERNDRVAEMAKMIRYYTEEKERALRTLIEGSTERNALISKGRAVVEEIKALKAKLADIRYSLDPANKDAIASDYDSKIEALKRKSRNTRLEPKVKELDKKHEELKKALKTLRRSGIDSDVVHEQLAALLAKLGVIPTQKENDNGPANQD